MRLVEEDANDDLYPSENVSWIAIEAGNQSGLEAWVAGSALTNHNWGSKPIAPAFSSAPAILATIQTIIDGEPAIPCIRNIAPNAFEAAVKEEASQSADLTHTNERLGYWAFRPGPLSTTTGELFGESDTLRVNHQWQTRSFERKYHNPVVVAAIQTQNESSPAMVRIKNVTDSSFQLHVDEWDYLDSLHASELVAYMVLEGSIPFDDTSSCDDLQAPLVIGSEIIAIDNCDQTVVLNFTSIPTVPSCNTPLQRIWSTADECGNAIAYTQRITVIDTVFPDFTVPADITLNCQNNLDDLSLTGDVTDETDNCAAGIQAAYQDIFNGTVDCDTIYLLNRVWSLNDNCGNTITKTQKIYLEGNGLYLSVRMKLMGAMLNSPDGLMRDNLRTQGLIPLEEPYKRLRQFEHVGQVGGTEMIQPGVLSVSGPNAIVDWVFIEIRDPMNLDSIIATRSALVQRDGDVVDVDGESAVRFPSLTAGSYHVAIRHRNHLGAMTLVTSVLTKNFPTAVDLAGQNTDFYGNHGVKSHPTRGKWLWGGDLDGNRQTIYQGPGNDVTALFVDVLSEPQNTIHYPNFIRVAYDIEDFDLDGQIIYQGPNNDRAKLLFNVVLDTPENVYLIPNFIVTEKLPR
jgi:hypothetical protein